MLLLGVMMAAVATVALKTRVLPLDAEFGPAFLLFLLWVTIASIVLTLRAGRATVVAAASSKAAWSESLR